MAEDDLTTGCLARWPSDDEPQAGIRLTFAAPADGLGSSDSRSSGTLALEYYEYVVQVTEVWRTVRGPLAYAVGAAASGVIGNFTYDQLKALAQRLDGRTPPTPPDLPNTARALALTAVRGRCAELALPRPPFGTLEITDVHRLGDVWQVIVTGGDSMEAEVRLPITPIVEDEPVSVRLRLPLPPS